MMKCRLRKFPLIHLLLLFFILLCKKKIFYGENIQYACNFYGTDLYVNVCRGVFRIQQNINAGTSLWKSQKNSIAVVRLGSKYASGIILQWKRFTKCPYLSNIATVNFVKVKNLFLELITNMLV